MALLAVILGAACSTTSSPSPYATATPSVVDSKIDGNRAVPDRLELPSIDADIPVVKLGWHVKSASGDAIFSEWDVAEYAAGWHKNSALPGEHGNVVMSGHNNILGSVFRELDQMRDGDKVIVWQGGERYVYSVDQVVIVPEKYTSSQQRADNAKWIGEFDDERLTLVSCWPRNNNTHRIIVVAHPDEDAENADKSASTSNR